MVHEELCPMPDTTQHPPPHAKCRIIKGCILYAVKFQQSSLLVLVIFLLCIKVIYLVIYFYISSK